MAIFARVVDKGTFRAAAKELDLAPSRVSQTISDLEQYLGVTLFYRTTRKLALTNEGKQFYKHATSMVRSAESGLNELNLLSQHPVGMLKITLPAFLEYSVISSSIAGFSKQYPDVSISLYYTDHIIDILNDGLDLSIRAGVNGISDSSMMSRKVGNMKRVLVASKRYVDSQALPKHPSDLQEWDWIRFQMRSNIIELISSSSRDVVRLPEKSRIDVNSVNALRNFVTQDLGITILPENLVNEDLKSGHLVRVLPEWDVEPLECYAVWPDKSRRENLTMLLVRHLVDNGLA
ncbi:LysR family transcriptional regulator [Eionea flava]